MSQLTPCPSCHRHIRVSGGAEGARVTCPFCDASVVLAQLEQTRTARRAPTQAGVKRAVLFAIGAGLTQSACSDDLGSQPVDGTPVAPIGVTSDSPSDTTDLAQPVYGAPVDPMDTTSAVDPDTTELAQPVYGAPVDPGDMPEPADAGVGDASPDAGDDGPDADSSTTRPPWNENDGGPLVMPVYGAFPTKQE